MLRSLNLFSAIAAIIWTPGFMASEGSHERTRERAAQPRGAEAPFFFPSPRTRVLLSRDFLGTTPPLNGDLARRLGKEPTV